VSPLLEADRLAQPREAAADVSDARLLHPAEECTSTATSGPPPKLAAEAREHVVRSGEVDLAVRETGPAGGPPVVLLHGLAINREYVLMRSSKLERSGYRVIAYDARGHGRSSAPAGPD